MPALEKESGLVNQFNEQKKQQVGQVSEITESQLAPLKMVVEVHQIIIRFPKYGHQQDKGPDDKIEYCLGR